MWNRPLLMFCAVSLNCRNVLPLGGASERSSAGPLTPSFTMGGTTSGNLCIPVITPIKRLDNGPEVTEVFAASRTVASFIWLILSSDMLKWFSRCSCLFIRYVKTCSWLISESFFCLLALLAFICYYPNKDRVKKTKGLMYEECWGWRDESWEEMNWVDCKAVRAIELRKGKTGTERSLWGMWEVRQRGGRGLTHLSSSTNQYFLH